MDVSDDIDKSWDHPWTTEEMRKKRREWSLAADVGLLKHLQQFSENLVSKTNKTQAALDTLTTQLKETEILVDNVTNTSLALANTQFIESRVQEDDIETKGSSEEKQETAKPQDSTPENLLASISESVKQGLNIMDEKYKVMDVSCSDSEGEDDGDVVFSVIVEPNDPYQDRPLPYVIGSNKWTASNKIGLESSSSESEQADEERDESDSEKEEAQKVFGSRHNPEINIARLSSSSSDSDNYNDQSSNVSYMNNSKIDAMSQNNINSASESATPNNISKTSSEITPNFAEELAKRLGTVRQAQKPAVVDETSESSINRFKDDLFAPEKNEDVFNDRADNLFSDKKGLFDDQVSANLWKEKPIKSYKSNIIPASIDVPPPISIVSTKPKSAIDDLFADADSEEDSDIFSSKNTVKDTIKKRTKETSSDDIQSANTEDIHAKPKNFLDVIAPGFANNIATSTPDSNVKTSGLFSDDENDDADLFGNSKKQSHKSPSASLLRNTTRESNRKEPVGGVSLLNNALMSDMESKLSSRIMQRQQESSDSDSDAPGNSDSTARSDGGPASSQRNVLSDIIAASENISAVNSNNTSGISTRPTSIDNTLGSGLCEPMMSSTRLRSEEIYRERITSDSLFVARTNQPADANSANANAAQQQPSRQEQQDIFSPAQNDSVFENDDLFGPPPLPSKSDSKRATKSKVSSLFDDSDSGDELFSAASSGSRSQKSTDFFAAASNDRAKPLPKSGGLFDDDVDIFGSKDAPEVDLFGVTLNSRTRDVASDDLFGNRGQDSTAAKNSNADKSQTTKMESKNISLFDDGDDGDLFAVKPTRPKNERKTELFEDEDDLFLSTERSNKERSSFVEKDGTVEPKIDVSKNISSLEAEKMGNDDFLQDGLFSKATKTHSSLFEEDDDYDDLFGSKDAVQRNNDRSKPESKEEIDGNDQIQKLPEEGKDSLESSSSNADAGMMRESSVVAEKSVNEERSKAVLGDMFSKEDGTTKKNSPPKTLNIRTIPSPPSEDQSNQQAPRKLVSGKIKNLMGKMGDLKILSPMDAPPLWRKSEEKTDEDEDVVDKDGDLSVAGRVSPPSVSEDSARKESSYSTISSTSNTEVAINFDDLAQVETLSTTASKSRVRIQAKRRPPSRHARKSALRHSGISFDTVDNDNSQEESHASTFSTKESSTVPTNNTTDHLIVNDQRANEPSFLDDKSELGSISKESSMSVNKNTLLSPSTDEEDLFDVPPDLPEDPQKEDTLFGRAPILSPVDRERTDKTSVVVEPSVESMIKKIDDNDIASNKSDKQDSDELMMRSDAFDKSESTNKRDDKRKETDDERNEAGIEPSEEPCDPLRDSSHDPLKDPSQLFAFVTKTPSPEKSRVLFTDPDDSLFSSGARRKPSEPKKKEILDLFADDDAGGDLFSAAPLKRTVKKPLRETKIDLFGDDNAQNEDSLFGSALSKTKLDNQKSNPAQIGRKKNIFDDDDDDDDSSLFIESSGQSQKSDSASLSESKHDLADSQTKNTSNLKNIFGNAPCDDDDDNVDLFATKKVVPKKVIAPSKSLFASDDDDEDGDDSHIFSKQSSASINSKAQSIATSSRPAMKKSVTRDLKKTAEKIVEDPLSLLQDD